MNATWRFLDLLAGHLYLAVFVANTIDATGIPFPGRLVLILAGAVVATKLEAAGAVLVGGAGALLGDHLLYLAGRRGGSALLDAYCRLTLRPERCAEARAKWFRRLGAPAILLSRYSTGIRLFAAILSGCGYIRYPRFVMYDVAGTLVYASVWVGLGHAFSGQVAALLAWIEGRWAVLLIVPAVVAGVLATRLWRRWRRESARLRRVEPWKSR